MPRADWKQLSQFKLKSLDDDTLKKLNKTFLLLNKYKYDFQNRKSNLVSMKMTILAGA